MKRNFCGFREYHLIREIKSTRKKQFFAEWTLMAISKASFLFIQCLVYKHGMWKTQDLGTDYMEISTQFKFQFVIPS